MTQLSNSGGKRMFKVGKRASVDDGQKFKFRVLCPSGDQPGYRSTDFGHFKGESNQDIGCYRVGKTFAMARYPEHTKTNLGVAPNKTRAQLYGEMKFSRSTVEYFVSYYDYYQPEAYVPRSDTYIEKDASVNEQIDRMHGDAC